ncbi:MAG: DUF2834 domain-containing protein [Cytophagia bacterium]|nr:DUF2834 domain-containing protein [Cytophagia bacterium]
MNIRVPVMKKYYIFLILTIIGGVNMIVSYFVASISNESSKLLIFNYLVWGNNFRTNGFTLDYWVVFLTLIFFMLYEGKRQRMPYYAIYPIITLLSTIAFGFPLFLFMRSQFIRKWRKSKASDDWYYSR